MRDVPDVRRLMTSHGMRRPGRTWWAAVAVCACLAGFGVYAYHLQFTYGEIVTGMRSIGQGGIAWGLYIVFDIFFIGVFYTGLTMSSLTILLNIRALQPLTRIFQLLSLVALCLAGCCVLADNGRPYQGLLYLPRYARTMSPLFGTFAFVVSGQLCATLVLLFLTGRSDARLCAGAHTRLAWFYRIWACGFKNSRGQRRRHRQTVACLSLFLIPLLLIANSTLGLVFGLQGGRAGWFGSLQAPAFVIMAGISGIGLSILIAAAIRRFLDVRDRIGVEAFRWMGGILGLLVAIYMYFMFIEQMTAVYASNEIQRRLAEEELLGRYAPVFWLTAGSLLLAFLVLAVQYFRKTTSIPAAVSAGLLVNLAAVLERYRIVVPSQTIGAMLNYPAGHYSPTWVEYGVMVGLFALGTLMFLVFMRIFPLIPVTDTATPEEMRETPPDAFAFARLSVSAVIFLAGVTTSVFGFMWSSRLGGRSYLDPRVPWSPMVFIAGLMLCFGSAVVYEVLPFGGETETDGPPAASSG